MNEVFKTEKYTYEYVMRLWQTVVKRAGEKGIRTNFRFPTNHLSNEQKVNILKRQLKQWGEPRDYVRKFLNLHAKARKLNITADIRLLNYKEACAYLHNLINKEEARLGKLRRSAKRTAQLWADSLGYTRHNKIYGTQYDNFQIDEPVKFGPNPCGEQSLGKPVWIKPFKFEPIDYGKVEEVKVSLRKKADALYKQATDAFLETTKKYLELIKELK